MALTLSKIAEGTKIIDTANRTAGYVISRNKISAQIYWTDGITSREPITRLINSECGYKII